MKTLTQSKTSTSSITNTKLAIATLAMLAAGGAALATIPLTNQKIVSEKTYSVLTCRQSTNGIYITSKVEKTLSSRFTKAGKTFTMVRPEYLKNKVTKEGIIWTYTCVGTKLTATKGSTNKYKLVKSQIIEPPADLPDLYLSELGFPDSNQDGYREISIIYTNGGNVTSTFKENDIKVEFLDKERNQLSSNPALFFDLDVVGANNLNSRAVRTDLPNNSNIKYVVVTIDVNDEITEKNEDNNVIEREVPAEYFTDYSDLTFQHYPNGLSFPIEPYRLSFTITNIGKVASETGVNIKIYWLDENENEIEFPYDHQLNNGNSKYTERELSSSIKPGGLYGLGGDIIANPNAKYVKVVIDPNEEHNDANRNNNLIQVEIPATHILNTDGNVAKTCEEVKVFPHVYPHYFDLCKAAGYNNVCLSKYNLIYKGCANDGVGCTTNNMYASENISCSVEEQATSTPTCTDTDGGHNVFEGGEIVNYDGQKYYDSCHNNYIWENYCNEETGKAEGDATSMCPAGYICKNGEDHCENSDGAIFASAAFVDDNSIIAVPDVYAEIGRFEIDALPNKDDVYINKVLLDFRNLNTSTLYGIEKIRIIFYGGNGASHAFSPKQFTGEKLEFKTPEYLIPASETHTLKIFAILNRDSAGSKFYTILDALDTSASTVNHLRLEGETVEIQ